MSTTQQSDPMADEQLVTVAFAKDYLGCSRQQVRALIQSGALPAVRIGPTGNYRIRRHNLDALLVEVQATG